MAGAPIGNQNGSRGRRWTKAIERVLARKYGDVDTGLESLATQYLAFVESKHGPEVLRDLGDRFEGKPTQALELSGPEGQPLPTALGIIAVQPVDVVTKKPEGT